MSICIKRKWRNSAWIACILHCCGSKKKTTHNMVKCRIKNFLSIIFSRWEARAKLSRNILNLPRALMVLEYPEMGFSRLLYTAAPRKESQNLSWFLLSHRCQKRCKEGSYILTVVLPQLAVVWFTFRQLINYRAFLNDLS